MLYRVQYSVNKLASECIQYFRIYSDRLECPYPRRSESLICSALKTSKLCGLFCQRAVQISWMKTICSTGESHYLCNYEMCIRCGVFWHTCHYLNTFSVNSRMSSQWLWSRCRIEYSRWGIEENYEKTFRYPVTGQKLNQAPLEC